MSDQPTRIKLYDQDHATVQQVVDVAHQFNRTITLHEVMREALHAGLPIVMRKYQAAVAAIANTK